MQIFSFEGKAAIINGASRGLRRAIASELAEAGAHVTRADPNVAKVEKSLAIIRTAGCTKDQVLIDLADLNVALATVSEVVRRRGRLDTLVNNAGIMIRGAFKELTLAQWSRVIGTNLKATGVLTRSALWRIMKQGWGLIINTVPPLSVIGRKGMTSYVARKHALASLTKNIAAEFWRHGINWNRSAPGYFNAEISTTARRKSGYAKRLSDHTALGRWGEPIEWGGEVVFPASETSSNVNCHVMFVGGITAAFMLPSAA